ncbi:hypothetical protein Hanom_Chr12g01094281 [Helianthus anomalus]
MHCNTYPLQNNDIHLINDSNHISNQLLSNFIIDIDFGKSQLKKSNFNSG